MSRNEAAIDLTNEIITGTPDIRIRERLIGLEHKALAAAKAEGAREAVERIRGAVSEMDPNRLGIIGPDGRAAASAMRSAFYRLLNDEEAAR